MKTLRIKSLVAIAAIGDYLLLMACFFVVIWARVIWLETNPLVELEALLSMLIVSAITFIAFMNAYDMYKNVFYRDKSNIIITVFVVIFLVTLVSLSVTFAQGTYRTLQAVLLYSALLQAATISLWRILILQIRRRTGTRQVIMIISELEEAKSLAMKIQSKQGHIFDVKYIYDNQNGIDRAFELIDKADHILLGSQLKKDDGERINAYCLKQNKNIFMIPDIFSINIHQAKFIQVDDIPLYNFSQFGLSHEQKFFKRSFDIILSSIALIITAPLFLIISAAIKLSDPGPVFYRQERVTQNNKKFCVIKFRTMVTDAEEGSGPVLAIDQDPRITKVGRILRSTRMDELPQIINVLAGSMSLVGPRPEREFFINEFVEKTPIYEYRTTVKAGITGLAQVLGKYTTTYEDKLRYDMLYIKTYSYLLDLKIIIKTVGVLVMKESSTGSADQLSFEQFMQEQSCRIIQHGNIWEIVNVRDESIRHLRPRSRKRLKANALSSLSMVNLNGKDKKTGEG